jgi:hypothetical protein
MLRESELDVKKNFRGYLERNSFDIKELIVARCGDPLELQGEPNASVVAYAVKPFVISRPSRILGVSVGSCRATGGEVVYSHHLVG